MQFTKKNLIETSIKLTDIFAKFKQYCLVFQLFMKFICQKIRNLRLVE